MVRRKPDLMVECERAQRSAIRLPLPSRGKSLGTVSGASVKPARDIDRVGRSARRESDGAGRQALLELAFGEGIAPAAGAMELPLHPLPRRQRVRGEGAVGLGAQQLPGLRVGQLGQETLPERGGVGLQPQPRWGIGSQQAPGRRAHEVEHPPPFERARLQLPRPSASGRSQRSESRDASRRAGRETFQHPSASGRRRGGAQLEEALGLQGVDQAVGRCRREPSMAAQSTSVSAGRHACTNAAPAGRARD